MYRSLLKLKVPFTLYYYCYDRQTFDVLTSLKKANPDYQNIIPVDIETVERERLNKIRTTRTQQEFFFTLTPFIIHHAIKTFKLDICTYIDADICFFKDPKIVFDEMKNHSVLITKHNYSKENEYLLYAGIYCVQFNPFKSDNEGMRVLEWWKDRCEEWCYLRQEDGKWGDQGYLNNWPAMFESVVVSNQPGAGLAPWNIRNFKMEDEEKLFFSDNSSKVRFDLIFYHFQSVKRYFSFIYFIGNGNFTRQEVETLYKPYLRQLARVTKEIKKINPALNPGGNDNSLKNLVFLAKKFIRRKLLVVPG
ncbi:MAG: hypothetical protein ACXVPQ_01450 [Bacteroidia bacterium]